MIYSNHSRLDDRIVERVVQSPATIKSLYDRLVNEEARLTLRAVYKSVNQLIAAGVLVKAGKDVSVDREWLRMVRERLSPAVPRLVPGERAAYNFVSVHHLDVFWKTIALELEEYEQDGQVFFYNPHNFWPLVPERKESEAAYYQHFQESKHHAFFTVGGDTTADMEFKRQYQNEYLQIDARNVDSIPRTHHLTVMGDHVVTVRVSKRLAESVDALYATGKSLAELQRSLIRLYDAPLPARLILERNPKKAQAMKKKLSRNFYFWQPK